MFALSVRHPVRASAATIRFHLLSCKPFVTETFNIIWYLVCMTIRRLLRLVSMGLRARSHGSNISNSFLLIILLNITKETFNLKGWLVCISGRPCCLVVSGVEVKVTWLKNVILFLFIVLSTIYYRDFYFRRMNGFSSTRPGFFRGGGWSSGTEVKDTGVKMLN